MAERKVALRPKQPKTPAPAGGPLPAGQFINPESTVRVGMPLPTGQPVGGYTEEEMRTLQQLPGWKPGDPVPVGLADVLEGMRQEMAQAEGEIKPPVPLDRPPTVAPTPVNIQTLSSDHQAELAALMQEAKSLYRPGQRVQTAPGATGVQEAIDGEGIVLVDDVSDPPPSRTGGVGQPLHKECPHCGWLLNQQDDVDPSPEDRRRYLEAMLGGKPFTKQFDLLEGRLRLVFRELSVKEVDACFAYADRELSGRDIPRNALDIVWQTERLELVGRARVALQLRRLERDDDRQTLPDSLEGWRKGDPALRDDVSVVGAVIEHLQNETLASESLARMVSAESARFNRLLAKLEANSHNPGFYLETT